MTTGDFEAVAWSWVDHLRRRGTRPWLDWVAEPAASPAAAPSGRLPGAAQLEAVRRMAGRPGSTTPRFAELADLVLGRAAPGRGPDDLPLVWPGDQKAMFFGPPPVDPSRLPDNQLVRVLVGAIADQLVHLPRPGASPAVPRSGASRRRGGRRVPPGAFPVAGSPAVAASLRAGLAATGQRPADPPAAAVVVAEPVDRMLGGAWTWRVRHGGLVPWPRYVERWARQGSLPRPADPAAAAARWADRLGPDRVHVLLACDTAEVSRVVAEVLGVPPDPEARGPRRLAPGSAELVRRVNRVLRGRVTGDRHRRLVRQLCRRLPDAGEPGRLDAADRAALPVPEPHTGWVRDMADRTQAALCSGGYVLHGDPAGLRPQPVGGPAFHESDLLVLALDTCLALAQDQAEARADVRAEAPAPSDVLTPDPTPDAEGGR